MDNKTNINQDGGFLGLFTSGVAKKVDNAAIEAAKLGNIDVLKFLLQKNLITSFGRQDAKGNTILHYLAMNKNSNDLTNNGTTAFVAAKFNNGADFGTANSTKYLSRAANIVAGNSDLSVSLWVKLTTEIGAGFYTLAHIDTTTGADRYWDI